MLVEDNTEKYKGLVMQFKEDTLKKAKDIILPAAIANISKPRTHRGGKSFNTYDTGNLSSSMTWNINGNTLQVGTPLEYAIYIEKGCKAHYMPVDKLTEWVKRKFKGDISSVGSQAPRGKKRKTQESFIKNLVFLINRSMSKNDMPAMPFLEPSVTENLEQLKQAIGSFNWDMK